MEDYIEEGLRQLEDKQFYQKLDSNPTSKHNKLINERLDLMLSKCEIHKDTYVYLKNDKPRTSQLYLSPKIHKNKHKPLARPIISANESPAERISQLINHFP